MKAFQLCSLRQDWEGRQAQLRQVLIHTARRTMNVSLPCKSFLKSFPDASLTMKVLKKDQITCHISFSSFCYLWQPQALLSPLPSRMLISELHLLTGIFLEPELKPSLVDFHAIQCMQQGVSELRGKLHAGGNKINRKGELGLLETPSLCLFQKLVKLVICSYTFLKERMAYPQCWWWECWEQEERESFEHDLELTIAQ